jgi:hypothetical protein
MCDIPLIVADEEKIIRAVFTNNLKRDGTLRETIFSPRGGPDEVSVMRHDYLGSDACKARAQAVKPKMADIKYRGFAVLVVKAVRETGSEVTDSREEFCGHAHISHGLPLLPEGDPLYSEAKVRLEERLRLIKVHARYLPDRDPSRPDWIGEAV